MLGINYVVGDATHPIGTGTKIIAHVCNDIGKWGAGFVLAVSARWREPESLYRDWVKGLLHTDFSLGNISFSQVTGDTWVCNMLAQHGVRSTTNPIPLRYASLTECLIKLCDRATQERASVHMPRIGCGLAGGKWEFVEPIIKNILCGYDVPVYVYDKE